MKMKKILINLKRHLLTGTSHMIPFIVAGGILFSISVMLNPNVTTSGNNNAFLYGLTEIGNAGLILYIPILGG